MRIFVAVASILALAFLAWYFLERWIASGSERFYVLVPIVFLPLFIVQMRGNWRTIRPQLREACVYVVVLAIGCTAFSMFMAAHVLPPQANGWLRGVSFREVLLAVYFLVALKLLLMIPGTLLRRGAHSLHNRYANPLDPDDPLVPVKRPLWPQFVPSLVLFPLILPYAMATLFVHRLKVPNPATPAELLSREYEDVQFQTPDGLTLRGWFLPAKERPSVRTVLICHGLGANRTNFLGFIQVADALEANALFFDFRGHGDSDGHTITLGHREKLDVLAAIEFLRTQHAEHARRVIGLGISMGTAGLIRAAAEVEPPLDAFILDSGFTSAVELTDSVLQLFPAFLRPMIAAPGVPLASLEAGCPLTAVRPIDQVHRLRAPVLFVHAEDDVMIPAEHSRRLYERAAEPKKLMIVATMRHGGALYAATPDYLEAAKRLVSPTQRSPSRARSAAE